MSGIAIVTPPLDGFRRLVLDDSASWTMRRVAAFHAAADHVRGNEPPIAACVAAVVGMLTVEDTERKGAAFIARKTAAFGDGAAFWAPYSLSYIVTVAARVRRYLALRPARVSTAEAATAAYHVDLARVAHRHRRYSEALRYCAKARLLGGQSGDNEAVILAALNAGISYHGLGRSILAREHLMRAALLAAVWSRPELQARAYHDLASVESGEGRHEAADECLIHAESLYPADDERRLGLYADSAYLWVEQGYYGRAQRVLDALLPRLRNTPRRTHAMGVLARAAASAGDKVTYERLWPEVEARVDSAPNASYSIRTRVELVIAHLAAGEHARAWLEARKAVRSARRAGEKGIVAEVQNCMRAAAPGALAPSAPPLGRADVDALAERIVCALVTVG